MNQYSETLRDLGVEEDKLGFPHEANRGMGMLTDKYIERMRQQLISWFTNIIQVICKPCCNRNYKRAVSGLSPKGFATPPMAGINRSNILAFVDAYVHDHSSKLVGTHACS